MKKVRKKKFIGALIGTIGSLASSAIQVNRQQQALDNQMNFQNQMINKQIHLNEIKNKEQILNNYNNEMYNKYQPILRMGGKRVKRKNLSKYKSRF